MVKLRLTRTGKKGQPSYRLVAIEARSKRDGEALEYLGHYVPTTKPRTFEVNKDRVQYWLGVGAQPTQTVQYLLSKEGLTEPVKREFKSKPGRKAQDRAAKAAAAAS